MRLIFTKRARRLELLVALLIGITLGFGLMALVASFVVVRAATTSAFSPPGLEAARPSQSTVEAGAEGQGLSSSAYRPGAAAELLGDLADATLPPTVLERKKCGLCATLRRSLASVWKISPAK